MVCYQVVKSSSQPMTLEISRVKLGVPCARPCANMRLASTFDVGVMPTNGDGIKLAPYMPTLGGAAGLSHHIARVCCLLDFAFVAIADPSFTRRSGYTRS